MKKLTNPFKKEFKMRSWLHFEKLLALGSYRVVYKQGGFIYCELASVEEVADYLRGWSTPTDWTFRGFIK